MNVSRPGTPDNMIQYQCTASNGVEKRATATVNVTVHCKLKEGQPVNINMENSTKGPNIHIFFLFVKNL